MRTAALVIGSGTNGLSAGIVLARAGFHVTVREAAAHIGGACSSAQLTLPGYVHDVGSAVHPLALASPFFEPLGLAVKWVQPPIALAHPLDDGTAVLLFRDMKQTAEGLGRDGASWRRLFSHIVDDWQIYRRELLGPLGPTRHPVAMARLGIDAAWSAGAVTAAHFAGERAKALFSGIAAHYPFVDQPLSAGFGLVLGAAAHAVGWPIPAGGAQSIANALGDVLREAGGVLETASPVSRLPEEGLVVADTSPHTLAGLGADRLPEYFRHQLRRFRYGPGAFKMDWALREPIPWRAKDCAQAGTVHLGGTADEIFASERAAVRGQLSEQPFVLLSQPTLFDSARAPAGRHTAWAYCHTPHGCDADRAAQIEHQIERFAPGFRDCILARHTARPSDLVLGNANLVGGDVTGGVSDALQMLFRPTWRRYETPDRGVYLCSSSSPPGAGVHGMCGYHAAHAVLKRYSQA